MKTINLELFTELTPLEEANLSGGAKGNSGKKNKGKKANTGKILEKKRKIRIIHSKISANGGDGFGGGGNGGNGGFIRIG